ncbi:MAG: hypothetical protein EA398_15495 [Deltaproteobacteria bacterium]|nr:MAG: hypothetical protein EA398_15495 [Deltaproteobacteria bacterium]
MRPDAPGTREPVRYDGDNPFVLEAIARLTTGEDLHFQVIQRTCSPNEGVCHNMQEYPDLRTPSSLVEQIGAPCNSQPGHWSTVYDRCEPPGDRFSLQNPSTQPMEIAWIERVPGPGTDYRAEGTAPELDSPGLHIRLHSPLRLDREEYWSGGQFIRTFERIDEGGRAVIEDVTFATYTTRWWVLEGGQHLVGEVRDYQSDAVNNLLSVGIQQGDHNRNGVFGYREGLNVPMVAAGDPERSYLVARVRGEMLGETVPGTRMPLANQPLSIPEMLAFFCWIEGLPTDGSPVDMRWPIDYTNCSYAERPEELNLLGTGTSWEGRVRPLFIANCGGCHGERLAEAEFRVTGDDAYERLFQHSTQIDTMVLLEPGQPENSYLWWKLDGHEQLVGRTMPLSPSDGGGRLSDEELADIRTWIEQGAQDN